VPRAARRTPGQDLVDGRRDRRRAAWSRSWPGHVVVGRCDLGRQVEVDEAQQLAELHRGALHVAEHLGEVGRPAHLVARVAVVAAAARRRRRALGAGQSPVEPAPVRASREPSVDRRPAECLVRHRYLPRSSTPVRRRVRRAGRSVRPASGRVTRPSRPAGCPRRGPRPDGSPASRAARRQAVAADLVRGVVLDVHPVGRARRDLEPGDGFGTGHVGLLVGDVGVVSDGGRHVGAARVGGQTLKRKWMTSPSATRYSLPSIRSRRRRVPRPRSRAGRSRRRR
jgi:hypothetical protein